MSRIITHSIHVPPVTDVKELMEAYNNLFLSMEIKNQINIAPGGATNFTHPVPESQAMLLKGYSSTYFALNSVSKDETITLINVRVTSSMITFIFQAE